MMLFSRDKHEVRLRVQRCFLDGTILPGEKKKYLSSRITSCRFLPGSESTFVDFF
jgi:hypothetical protein